MTSSGLNKEASVAKAFFLGNIIEENLFPFPKFSPSEMDTLGMVLESVDKFMQSRAEDYREYDKVGAQPTEYIESLKELGLFGLIIPEEYSGIGLTNAGYSRVLQQTSRYDASTSLTIGAHSSIGMKGLLLFGTDEQKKRYLSKLATGEMIAAFCLTEPGAGSDAASIKTHAHKNPDGTWTLNGEKIWITNGGIAQYFTVFAKTDSSQGKMTAFIVERDFPGVTTGPKEDKMGIRASITTTVNFNNVKIPPQNVLGEEGKGFKVAMSILNNGRTGLGGGCVGAMKGIISHAIKQAAERKQFGQAIHEFGLIKEKIARMTVNCFAAESVVNMVAYYIDNGLDDFSVEAAISKIYASEALWDTAFEGLQIAGGNGFMREYPYERVVRDSRINLIFEGTNEILRLYVALSGMKDAGDYLKDVSKGLGNIFNDPIKGFGVLSGYAGKKIGALTSRGRDRVTSVDPALRSDALIYEQYVQELSQATETVLRRHGKDIINKQFAMKRVADIAIDLFVGLSMLSRISAMIKEKGEAACKQEINISHIFTQQAKRRMNQNLRRVDKNEDEIMKDLSDHVVKHGYGWDLF